MLASLDKIDRLELLYRVLLFFLNSIFISAIPVFAFIIYMGDHGFFSYDFFVESIFALNVFMFVTSVVFLLVAASLCGSASLIFAVLSNKENRKNVAVLFCLSLFFALNAFAQIYMAWSVADDEKLEVFDFLLFVNVIGIPLYIHLGSIFTAKPKAQFFTFTIMAAVTFYSMIAYSQLTSDLVGLGLRGFGVGGGRIVVIENRDDRSSSVAKGSLIFMSPQNLYLNGATGEVVLVERSSDIVVTVNPK